MTLVAVLLGVLAAEEPAESIADIASRVKPAVVHLRLLDASGQDIGSASGFFVSPDGLVVTNEHVVRRATRIQAQLLGGEEHEVVGLMARDETRDLAVVKVEGAGYPALTLDPKVSIAEGIPVVVIGSPYGLSWTVSEGIVSALRPQGLPLELQPANQGGVVQITAPMSPGSSGSPVVDREGRVIGVGQSIVAGGGNLSFAVPVQAVVELLDTVGVDQRPLPFNPSPLRNLYISLAVFGGMALAYFGFRVFNYFRFAVRARSVRIVKR